MQSRTDLRLHSFGFCLARSFTVNGKCAEMEQD